MPTTNANPQPQFGFIAQELEVTLTVEAPVCQDFIIGQQNQIITYNATVTNLREFGVNLSNFVIDIPPGHGVSFNDENLPNSLAGAGQPGDSSTFQFSIIQDGTTQQVPLSCTSFEVSIDWE